MLVACVHLQTGLKSQKNYDFYRCGTAPELHGIPTDALRTIQLTLFWKNEKNEKKHSVPRVGIEPT